MRCTHCHGVCGYRHFVIKCIHRNLKCRVSILVDRLIFLIIYDHIIVIRTAPYDCCCNLAIFDLKGCRRIYACLAASAFHGNIDCILSVFKLQILDCFFVLRCPCCFSIGFFLWIGHFYFMVIPFIFLSDQSNIKFLIDCRNRNIKSINFFTHAITVGNGISRRLKKFCAIFFCIFCCSHKQIYNAL